MFFAFLAALREIRDLLKLIDTAFILQSEERQGQIASQSGHRYAFPLLNQRIVEFALSIPGSLYFKNGWKRFLYRTAMAGILSDP